METSRIPLPALLETRDSELSRDGLLTNCYIEENPEGATVVKRPGNVLEAQLGTGCTGQGAFYFDGIAVFVACDTLYSVRFVTLSTTLKAGGI